MPARCADGDDRNLAGCAGGNRNLLKPAYKETDDVPALYGKTAWALILAPFQHTEEAYKRLVGSSQAVVETLGMIRNEMSSFLSGKRS